MRPGWEALVEPTDIPVLLTDRIGLRTALATGEGVVQHLPWFGQAMDLLLRSWDNHPPTKPLGPPLKPLRLGGFFFWLGGWRGTNNTIRASARASRMRRTETGQATPADCLVLLHFPKSYQACPGFKTDLCQSRTRASDQTKHLNSPPDFRQRGGALARNVTYPIPRPPALIRASWIWDGC